MSKYSIDGIRPPSKMNINYDIELKKYLKNEYRSAPWDIIPFKGLEGSRAKFTTQSKFVTKYKKNNICLKNIYK